MRKSLLLASFLLIAFASRGQILLSESFNVTAITTTMPTGWTTTSTGSNTGCRTSTAWSQVASGGFPSCSNYPTPSAHSGSGMAGFESWWISTGGTSELITPVLNFSTAGSKILSFWINQAQDFYSDKVDVYINTSAAASGGSLMTTIFPSNFPSTTGWVQYNLTIPTTFTGTTNYIIFKATSAYGEDMFIDDVTVTNLVPCSGAPTAGTASASPNPACPSVPLTLTSTGYTVGSGILYQWQSSPAGANTWTNIAGATTPVYTIAAGITAATDFRLFDSCTSAGGSSALSNTVAVTLNSFLNCYCNTSAATINNDDDIGQVVLGTFANPATAPSPILSNSTALGTYTNYTALGPINMFVNSPTTFTATQIEYSTGFYGCYLKVFIDLNHDGLFTGAGETVFAQQGPFSNTGAPHFSGTITIPTGSLSGLTRMRVTLQESGSNASVTPCNSYTWGETEDYTVNILPQTPPSPTVVNNGPVCPSATIIITATSTYPTPTYTLTGPGISSTTSSTGIFNITNATASNNGTYSVTVTSGGFTSLPATTNVVVNPVPAITISNITSPSTCLVNDASFQVNNLLASTVYTLTYRKNGVNVASSSITSTAGGVYVVTGLSAGNYDSIRVKTPQGCFSTIAAALITAPNPPAKPTALSNSPLCPGSTLQLNVVNPIPGATYSWTGPGGFAPTPGSAAATRSNLIVGNSGSYKVTVTVLGCLSSPDSVNVIVNPPDAPPLPNNVTYCQFDNASPLTAGAAPGSVLKWYTTLDTTIATGQVPGSGSTTAFTPSTLTPTPFPTNIIYYVTQTLTCESPRVPVYVIVNPKPQPPTVPASTLNYCQYEQVGPLSANGSAIRWFTTSTGGTPGTTAPTPVTLVPGTYFYYVSQTVNGCESDRTTIRVIVKPKPQPPAVTSPLNLCQGDPVAPLTAVGQSLLWYTIPSGGVGVPVAPLPNTGYEDSFKYYVTQTVNGCESDRALVAVYVRYKPNGIITANNQWVCQDENLTFNYFGNARPNAEFVWFAPLSAHFVSGQGTPGPVVIHFDTAGTSVVQLIINNKGCISTLLAAPITVRPLPKISFVNRQDVCEDELVTISLNHIEPDITGYSWNFGSDDIKLEYGVVTTGGPFGVRYPNAGHYQVSATATKDFCTSKPIYQEIYVHEKPDARITASPSPVNICASDTLFLTVRRVEEGAVYTWTPAAYFQGHKDTLNNEVFAVVSQNSVVKVNIKTAFGCEGTDSVRVTTKPCCGVYFANAFAPGGRVEQNRTFKPITEGIHKINTFRILNRWGQVVYETKVERNGWDGTLNGVPQDMGTYYYYISYKCEGKDVEERGEFLLMR